MGAFTVTSSSFRENGRIGEDYTCDGRDRNPALLFDRVPAGTRPLALIMDDPDAPGGTWTHWVLWNIGPETRQIRNDRVPEGALQGINDFRKAYYGGPCPPSGSHHYFFRLYALDTMLDLKAGAARSMLESAMQGHVLASMSLMRRYARH
jgi:Raf kinase inhibitor-like YbhB/YbcL family protein